MYRHTQVGWTMLSFFLAALSFIGAVALPGGGTILFLAVVVVLGLMAILFHSLTVVVDASFLRWHFGPGFWKKELPLETIERVECRRCSVVTTRRGMR